MANKFPLILNTSANQIQEIASGDNLDLTGCGINNAGVITATSFSGNITGNVTGNADTCTTATRVTVWPNNSTDATHYITFADAVSGSETIDTDTGLTYNPSSGNLTSTQFTGTLQTAAQTNITSVGTLSSLNVSGNVSIGGTLTYEDVTNIDSVGLITARNGINVSAGTATFQGAIDANSDLDVDGHTNLDNVSVAGVTTFFGTTNIDSDTAKLQLGTSQDLQLYHTSNLSTIKNTHANGVAVRSNVIMLQNAAGDHDYLTTANELGVTLFYDNAPKLATTNTGAVLTGTDFGFNATPGGTPAGKAVFLAIGDSDTGIVQDGDGQLELWANNTEVANINAIDGYTSVKPITTTGNVSVGDFTAKSALFTDNGTASPVVELRTDDAASWALQIANDTYSNAGHGLHFNIENGGQANIRNIGASSYNDIKIGVVNGSTYHQTLTIDETGIVVLGNSGVSAGRLSLTDDGSNSPLLKIKTDDGSPYAMIVGNDTYNTGNYGLHQYQENGGNYFIRLVNNAEYKNLYIQTSNNSTHSTGIYIDNNRSVGLNYEGGTRFWTRSNGATVQGNSSTVSLDFNSNSTYRGSLYADNNNNIGILDHTGNWVFLTNRGAANAVLYDSHFRSDTNGSYDLGSSSYRWRDVYTSDLDLSNEAKGGNTIDGTWGSYKIEEGENDLFLINRRNGKKYKFNLTEVD